MLAKENMKPALVTEVEAAEFRSLKLIPMFDAVDAALRMLFPPAFTDVDVIFMVNPESAPPMSNVLPLVLMVELSN